MTASAVNPETARKRIQRGWSWDAATSAPATRRNPRTHRRDPEPPCPLNAEFREWTHTSRGRALQLLDVNTDPLRGAL